MDLSKLNILVISSDKFLIKKWRKESAFLQIKIQFAYSYDEASFLMINEPYQLLIIDWQLQSQSGIEAYKQLHQQYPLLWAIKILLVADSESALTLNNLSQQYPFIDWIRRPESLEYLLKSNCERIESYFNTKKVRHQNKMSHRRQFYSLLLGKKASEREFYKCLDQVTSFIGYDLIIIYSFMQFYKSSGILMVQQAGRVTGVHFENGLISQVDAEDQKDWLNKIKFNYNDEDNFEHKQLVFESLQATLLSLTLQSEPTTVAFTKNAQILDHTEVIRFDFFYQTLAVWVTAKVKNSWLQLFFLNFEQHRFYLLPEYDQNHPIFNTEIVKIVNPILYLFETPKSWGEIVIRSGLTIDVLQKAILLLILANQIGISLDQISFNVDLTQAHLNDFYQRIYRLDHISLAQYLNAILQFRHQDSKEWKLVYIEYLGVCPPSIYPELQALWFHLKQLGEQAIDKVSQITQVKDQQKILKLKNYYFEQRVNSLLSRFDNSILQNKAEEAEQIVDELLTLAAPIQGLILMKIWTNLINNKAVNNSSLWIQISHEEQFDISYFYVKALQAYYDGNLQLAKRYFTKVLLLNPNYPYFQPDLKHKLGLSGGVWLKIQTIVQKIVS